MAPAWSPFNPAGKFPAECQAGRNSPIQSWIVALTDTGTCCNRQKSGPQSIHKMDQNTEPHDMALSHMLCSPCISSASLSSFPSPYSCCSHWLFNTWRKTEAKWLTHKWLGSAGALEEVKTDPSNMTNYNAIMQTSLKYCVERHSTYWKASFLQANTYYTKCP